MKGNIIYKKTIPARSPEYAEFPKSLHPDIQDFHRTGFSFYNLSFSGKLI